MFPQHSPIEDEAVCSVCQMGIDKQDAVKGENSEKVLYFCCLRCLRKYEEDPKVIERRDLNILSESADFKKMLKELSIIHYSAPPKVAGGVEIVIGYHARALADLGFKVHIIYGDGGGLDYKGVVEHHIPLLSVNHPKIVKLQASLIQGDKVDQFNRIKEQILQELDDKVPDAPCIVHNIPSMPFNFAATAAINELAEKRSNIVYWLHDSTLLRKGWREKIGKFPYSLLHHKNEAITFVTPTSFRAKQFKSLPAPYDIPHMIIIPNGISIDEYIKIDQVTKLLMKRLGLSFSNHIIVLPVRVTPRKNVELALYVVDELRKMIAEEMTVKLLITGPPDHHAKKEGLKYMKYLLQIIQERDMEGNVTFCSDVIDHFRVHKKGEILKWSVADIYNIADLIFVPSKEEGFGLPVIEAGASRKPVFCSRIQPFKELFREGLEGDMFDLDDPPKDIAERIYKLWLNDKVDNHFENVVMRFSWDSIIEKKLIPLLSR